MLGEVNAQIVLCCFCFDGLNVQLKVMQFRAVEKGLRSYSVAKPEFFLEGSRWFRVPVGVEV